MPVKRHHLPIHVEHRGTYNVFLNILRLQSNCSSAYTDRQQLLMNSDFILRFRANLECLCSLLLQVCYKTNKSQ